MQTATKIDAPAAWRAYAPTEEAPWNLRRVVHLHRRAGFGATFGELQRDLEQGPVASVERVLAGRARGARAGGFRGDRACAR